VHALHTFHTLQSLRKEEIIIIIRGRVMDNTGFPVEGVERGRLYELKSDLTRWQRNERD
jgi:hypothetical protein